jgi:diguanylate cyclase (GGDEF)-like protein/PAS domain S-box-containing protein
VAARFLANRQLINLIRASMHGIVTVDDQCNITLINPCAERQFRVHARDTLGSHLAKLIPEITLEHLDKHLTPDPTGKLSPLSSTRLSTAKTTKFTGRRGDSTLFPIEAVVFDTTANNVRYLTLLIEDVSKKVQLQTQHEENLTRLRILSDLAPVGILQVNTEWQCVYANDQWMCLSGLNRQETMGPNWVNAISPFEAEPVLNNLSQCLLRQTDYQHQLCLVSPLGQRRWVQMTARGLYDHSGQNLTGFLATFSDISEQRLAQEKLRTLAESDALTGLVNRAYLTQQVHTLLSATTESTQIALLYIDLDGFKQVNDSYGHAAGDKLLKVVAHRLCQAVRDTDMVARLGGDEFAILLDNLPNAATADKIADKILHTLSQPIQIAKDVEIYVGASIGITLTNPGDIHADRLLMQADIAMYHAKTSGKNKSCVYSAALGTQIARKMELRNQLHRAVEQEDLSVYFQPQIKLSTGTIWGFEALLRWRDSKGNHVPPSEFVPILEETGLVRSVGIWVIQQATTTLMHWRNLGLVSKDTTISVNVSAIQLHDRSFVDGVAQALAISKLPPAALVIEITETALVQGTLSQEILHALRALGVKISLDDFGTGYSSLSYITRLPLDHLKIDRSFIARNPSDTHGVHVTQAIISMAKGLGLTVVAEGVDSFERLTMLKTTNCDIYQGFYFSQAITRDEIQSQLNATRDEMQSPPNQINPDAGQKAPASGSWTCHSLVDNT